MRILVLCFFWLFTLCLQIPHVPTDTACIVSMYVCTVRLTGLGNSPKHAKSTLHAPHVTVGFSHQQHSSKR